MQLRKESLTKTKIQACRAEFEPCPLRYRCSALTNMYYNAVGRYPISHVYLVFLLYLRTFTVYVFRTLSVKYGLCT